jgi:hypothetical protein
VYTSLLAVAVYFTQATTRRILGALATAVSPVAGYGASRDKKTHVLSQSSWVIR